MNKDTYNYVFFALNLNKILADENIKPIYF